MFVGVVHANARKALVRYIPALPPNAHIICSGNFTIETTLRMNGYKGRLTGCDVSLYTCMLGAYFGGRDLRLEIDGAKVPELLAMEPHLHDQEGRAACVAVALDILQHWPRRNRFQERMWAAGVRRLDELVGKTREKLRQKREIMGLADFFPQDGWVRAGEIPPGPEHCVLTFPPTYAKGYEKLYKLLDEAFIWDRPPYKELTSGAEFTEKVIARPGPWIVGAEERIAENEKVLGVEPIAQCSRGTGVNVYLYSNMDLPISVVRRSIQVKDPGIARLSDRDDITLDSSLTIHRMTSAEVSYIRQVYASVEIPQGSAEWSYGVAVDGKLIGILLFNYPAIVMNCPLDPQASEPGKLPEPVMVFMMADIAIASERYPRLSKLLLMASVSSELQRDLSHRAIFDFRYNMTAVFSKHPASMKYRGIFEMTDRKKKGDIYKLTYCARFGKWTLQEAMRQ
jgi:hypothetical protein